MSWRHRGRLLWAGRVGNCRRRGLSSVVAQSALMLQILIDRLLPVHSLTLPPVSQELAAVAQARGQLRVSQGGIVRCEVGRRACSCKGGIIDCVC